MFPLRGRPTTAALRLPSDPSKYTNTPIRRLPNELLVEIFKYCVSERQDGCDPDYPSQWKYDWIDRNWLDILLVCRHWYHVACATPALWRSIPVNSKRQWFDLCVARSAGMAVYALLYWKIIAQSLSQAVETIVAHASQIGRLVLIAHEMDGFDDLERIWHTRMPLLEDFTFYILADHGAAECAVAMHLKPVLFPALRALRLSGPSVSLPCPIVSQLHTLRLSWVEPIPFWSSERVLEALQAVAQHAGLRHLELSRAYFPQEHLQYTYPISFPNLHSLVLIGYDTCSISRLLPHLRLGPNVDVRLIVDTSLEDWEDNNVTGLLHLIPEDTKGLPLLRTTSSVSIAFEDVDKGHAKLEIICTPGPDSHRRERLAFQLLVETHPEQDRPEWGYTLDDSLSDFSKRFAASPLSELSVREFGASGGRRASAGTLLQVFRTFPTLAIVQVEYNDPRSSCQELLKALSSHVSDATVQNEDGTPESPPQTGSERVVLPDLRAFRITQLPWRENVLPSIVTCLQRRAVSGSRLEDLHIELYNRPRVWEVERSDWSHYDLLLDLQSLSTRLTYLDGEAPTCQEAVDRAQVV